jgi:hypothetical protein
VELRVLPQVDLRGEPPLGQLGEQPLSLVRIDPDAAERVGLEDREPTTGVALVVNG